MNIRTPAMLWFVILFVVTAVLALIVPPSHDMLQNFHISINVYHFVVFTLLLPYGLIWLAAFYGYEQMQAYAHTVRSTNEGRAFKKIADGLRVFAWGMVLTAILGLLLSLIHNAAPSFAAVQAIINHYAMLVVALAAFTLISDGTYMLFEFVRAKRTQVSMRLLVLLATVVGLVFVRLVGVNLTNNDNPYYLSVYPLLLTFIAPYVYAWTIAAIATSELRAYAHHATGVLYQRALQSLTNGLTIIILVSIASQYIAAAFTAKPGSSLGSVLIVNYALLAVEALGFVMVALGAKRMKRFEEV